MKFNIKVNSAEAKLLMDNSPRQLIFSTEKFIHIIDLTIIDVESFIDWLQKEITSAEFHRITLPRKYYLKKADNVIYEKILKKVYVEDK